MFAVVVVCQSVSAVSESKEDRVSESKDERDRGGLR
jgi:hypothetical protein